MDAQGMELFAGAELERFAAAVLESHGVDKKTADIVAWSLVEADLRGHNSHGLMRLGVFVERVKRGVHDAANVPTICSETDNTALIDARHGFGQVAIAQAVELAIQKAKTHQVGAVSVRNSQNFGSLGPFVETIAEHGLIGFLCTNGAPAMAPTNGDQKTLGTNPLAFSVPYKQPLTLDMSTTTVARDKITLAKRLGQEIPFGWALDETGNPTTDPDEALKGSLQPLGGAKGYGLALAVEVIGAILSDSNLATEVGSLYDFSRPQGAGHFVLALNIEAFTTQEQFRLKMDKLVSQVKGAKSTDVGEPIYLPGEIELKTRAERLTSGIPLAQGVVEELTQLGESVGVSLGRGPMN